MREHVWLVVNKWFIYFEDECLTHIVITADSDAEQKMLDRQEKWLYKNNNIRKTIYDALAENIVKNIINLIIFKKI